MRSTIDRGGGNVGSKVQDGHMEIEPVPLTITLQPRGSLVVAVPQANQSVMRAADVDRAIAELRNGPMEQEPAEYYL